jgi:hypothetical protein
MHGSMEKKKWTQDVMYRTWMYWNAVKNECDDMDNLSSGRTWVS